MMTKQEYMQGLLQYMMMRGAQMLLGVKQGPMEFSAEAMQRTIDTDIAQMDLSAKLGNAMAAAMVLEALEELPDPDATKPPQGLNIVPTDWKAAGLDI